PHRASSSTISRPVRRSPWRRPVAIILVILGAATLVPFMATSDELLRVPAAKRNGRAHDVSHTAKASGPVRSPQLGPPAEYFATVRSLRLYPPITTVCEPVAIALIVPQRFTGDASSSSSASLPEGSSNR